MVEEDVMQRKEIVDRQDDTDVLMISSPSSRETETIREMGIEDSSGNHKPDSFKACNSVEGFYEEISRDLSSISSQEDLDYDEISDGELLDVALNPESPLCTPSSVLMDLPEVIACFN
jgi:hypothetical protein